MRAAELHARWKRWCDRGFVGPPFVRKEGYFGDLPVLLRKLADGERVATDDGLSELHRLHRTTVAVVLRGQSYRTRDGGYQSRVVLDQASVGRQLRLDPSNVILNWRRVAREMPHYQEEAEFYFYYTVILAREDDERYDLMPPPPPRKRKRARLFA